MKTVCEKNMCTGCMACLEICPKAAIKVKDSLKFFNAVIDDKLCVNCNACHEICQNNTEPFLIKPEKWYEGWSVDKREYSSSGGAAAAIISAFIQQGGIACSCAFRDGKFGFYFAPDEVDPGLYRGSKYVKSNPEGIYRRILNFLRRDKRVLFLGLPCQVAAIKGFVGKRYQDRLYTVDLICHGSPSPKLLEIFLHDYSLSLNKLEKITFRNKTNFRLLTSAKDLEPARIADIYTFTFLKGLNYTENCYHCRYACQERASDITLGDSWGSDLPSEEQQKGVSLILCQTEKGVQLVKNAKLELLPVNYEKAVESNHQLRHPSVAPAERERFFELLGKGKSFKSSVAGCYPQFYMKQSIKKVLVKFKFLGDRL